MPATLSGGIGRVREPVSGQRRDHEVVPGREQQRDDPLELEHRPGPAVDQQDRHPRSVSLQPPEVDAVPREVGERVQPQLGRSPLVGVGPVVAQLLEVGHIRSQLPAVGAGELGPPCAPQALAQVGQHRLGHRDLVRLGRRHGSPRAGSPRRAATAAAGASRPWPIGPGSRPGRPGARCPARSPGRRRP